MLKFRLYTRQHCFPKLVYHFESSSLSNIFIYLFLILSFAETIMIVAWATLFFGGIAFQLYREWNRPKFPPCPRKNKGINSRRISVRRSLSQQEDMGNEPPPPYSEHDDFDERTPLLTGQPRQIDHWPRQQELEEHSNNM